MQIIYIICTKEDCLPTNKLFILYICFIYLEKVIYISSKLYTYVCVKQVLFLTKFIFQESTFLVHFGMAQSLILSDG